jgi:hypothetical protein
MKTNSNTGAWCFTLLILVGGVVAVASHRLVQGKGIYVVGRLEGNAAVFFGGIMIAIGLYFVWLLLRDGANKGDERSGENRK